MAYVMRADLKAMKAVTPEPIEIVDDVIEFWYVIPETPCLGHTWKWA
jgi:acetoacetate decarboxylase